MSAKAPLGTPSSSTGKVDAVCTNAMRVAELVRDVIIQAAATSFIHMQILATSHTSHNDLKTLFFRGDSQPSDPKDRANIFRIGYYRLNRDLKAAH